MRGLSHFSPSPPPPQSPSPFCTCPAGIRKYPSLPPLSIPHLLPVFLANISFYRGVQYHLYFLNSGLLETFRFEDENDYENAGADRLLENISLEVVFPYS